LFAKLEKQIKMVCMYVCKKITLSNNQVVSETSKYVPCLLLPPTYVCTYVCAFVDLKSETKTVAMLFFRAGARACGWAGAMAELGLASAKD
jgi:hypothetical protein